MMKKTLLLFVALLALPFVLHAQISPIPQQATYGGRAFGNQTAFTLVGADRADASAVALAKNRLPQAQAGQPAVRLVLAKAGDKAVKAYRRQIPTQAEGYYLRVTPQEVVIAGRDEAGTYYGMQSFLQLMERTDVMQCEVTDWPSVSCRGVIEGFYGNPWSHEDRLRQFEFYGRHKMNTYVYGPKDDPYHRAHWRDPYPAEEARRLQELVEAAHRNKVQFVWAIHPGNDIRWNLQDSMAVVAKLEQMYALGIRTFSVFFDDIWGEGAKGDKQAGLMNYVTDQFVRKYKDVQPLILCPTQYNRGWSHGDYLSTLGTQMYPEVRIMWTGHTVVDMIGREDMEWINGQIRRKAFIWLNYPVNDYCQSRMLMGKTYGNDLDIHDLVSGFCSNPMEYAEASKVSLYSIADYTWNMPRYDAETSWRRAMDHVMPTSKEAFRFFCEQNIDLGRTGHGLRREGESADFRALGNDALREMFFMYMQAQAVELLADSVNQPEMLREIAPWVESMNLLGQRGRLACTMQQDLNRRDTIGFIGRYKAQLAADRAQKAITSRDFEGSIVKAKPVVSGDVITPWVNERIDSLVRLYKQRHTYGLEVFPVQSISDGEYFIKVNGRYLTNAQASPDRVGDHPVFQAERDVINPQRQQWVIQQDSYTGRYRITNKQDGRYVNERGAFWANREHNPYEPTWHTYSFTRQDGHYSIQCGGNAGGAFWTLDGDRLGNSPTEQTIFEIEAVE